MQGKITYRTIPTTDPMFRNRGITMLSGSATEGMKLQSYIPVPDNVVLCDGCNTNLYPRAVDAVYINGELHGVYCKWCRERYFPRLGDLWNTQT